jgi:hypothetical protein
MRIHQIDLIMQNMQVSDISRVLAYRAEFFGSAYSTCLQDVLRGPSEWSVGERELFAAFTSYQNQCQF